MYTRVSYVLSYVIGSPPAISEEPWTPAPRSRPAELAIYKRKTKLSFASFYQRPAELAKEPAMAFYGDLSPVESFIYRKVLAEVFRAVKGGHCEKCDLDLEPEERACPSCGDEIFPSQVYPIKVSGNLIGWDGDTLEEAKELARAWIDNMLDDPEPPKIEIDDFPRKGLKGRKGRKQQLAKRSGGPKNMKLVDQVKQLGWGKKALAILRGPS